jgi:Heavy metal binding domain
LRAITILLLVACLVGAVGAQSSSNESSKSKPSAPTTPAPNTKSFADLSISERLKALEQLAPTYDYSCVMHADVHQAQEGSCPKCGMPLQSLTPVVRGEYKLQLISTPLRPPAGRKVSMRFIVSHPNTGARVKYYVLNHDKLFHLFIISQDLEAYQHLHPQLQPDGSFSVETVLPRAGQYKLHADFFPVGGTLQVLHRDLATVGNPPSRAPVTLQPDESLTKTIDGTTIKLEWGNKPLTAGVLIPLRYHLSDARTGAPINDLEPYLGAWGHTLILNADQSEYLHSHPTEMLPDNTKAARGGPMVEFRAMFPAAGSYRIWTQFQRNGRIITATFTVRCE